MYSTNGPVEYRVFGPPGCGKTTWLQRQVENAVAKHGRESVMVTSLTHAAKEAAIRKGLPIPDSAVGTLHSLARRAMGETTELAFKRSILDTWNSAHRSWVITPTRRGEAAEDVGDDSEDTSGKLPGDLILEKVSALRCRMIPTESWVVGLRAFYSAWSDWKNEMGVIDFTDMIERALIGTDHAPGSPRFIFCDEAQDMDRLQLELVRKWSLQCEKLILIGDPDQCQPGETQIQTTSGLVRLDELDAESHRLVSFDRRASCLVGWKNGYSFRKAERSYSGAIYTITAGGHSTRTTHDHRWLVKWSCRDPVSVVYLMRRGDRWRVGWCQLFMKGTGAIHLGVRTRLEDADGAWILKVFKDRAEASQYENIVAIKYGLPMITFAPRGAKGYTSQIDIDAVFSALDPQDQWTRALSCLVDHRLDPRHPFYKKSAGEYQGKRTPLVVRACNLIPELMAVPVPKDKRSVTWEPFTISREPVRDFKVYSLDVPPHHDYVADGIVTMNNLYEFRGTDSTNFMNPPIPKERQMVLSQSYRVPAAVHAVAVKWVRRIKKRIDAEYKPTEEPGSVSSLDCPFRRPDDLIPEIVKRLDAGKRVMLLASCHYMLGPTISLLRANGIPFHNEYSDRGVFNPLKNAKSVMGYLATDEELHGEERRLWTWKELRQWTDYLRSDGILRHGAKADIKRRALEDGDSVTTMEELRGLFLEGAVKLDNIGWLDRNQTKGAPKNLRYMANIASKRGKRALVEEPALTVGTIHSVKGGESDCVFLFLSLFSEEFEYYSEKSTRGYDSIIRKFYVAMTRARQELVLLEQSDLSSIEVSDVL